LVNPNTSLYGTLPTSTDATAVAGTGKTEAKVKQDSVLASYDFGVAKVVATYNTTKTTTLGVIATPKREDLTVGVSVPVGAWNFIAQYGEGDQSTGVAGAAKTDVKGYQVGALYNLSKRTAVYGLYGDHETKVDNAAYKASADAIFQGVLIFRA